MKTDTLKDTIAAIVTPLSTAGVGIIRISGSNSWIIAKKLFFLPNGKNISCFKHSKFYYGWIKEPGDNSLVDEVILLSFKGPKSYTGEDVIEIQCHGGVTVVKKILNLCLQNSSRLAVEGEFTKRAFINGRIDLTQVEAVLDIISARTDLFSSSAAYNLSGKLSIMINETRIKLIDILASIHAHIDYPDEVDEMPYQDLEIKILEIINTLEIILNKATNGNILKHGINVAIVGKPNVGKSSLFNTLLNRDRAIVTNIPGTTRDILEETIEIDGIPVILTDTAGIRDFEVSCDSTFIEQIGIDRSKDVIKSSDLILFLYDITEGIKEEDDIILKKALDENKLIIKVANKLDAKDHIVNKNDDEISISAINGYNIEELKQKIKSKVLGNNINLNKNQVYINMRHQESINNALKYLNLTLYAVKKGELQDFISIDIRAALISLNEIVGELVTEDIIDSIFSQFCVGK